MTSDLDLSPEAVERLADDCILASKALRDTGTFETGQAILGEAAAALRALLDENARLRAERDAAWQAGAKAMREAAINAVPNGWQGTPHISGLDYGPTTASKAIAAIRALPIPDKPLQSV